MLTTVAIGTSDVGAYLNGGTISGVGLAACGWAVWHRRATWRLPYDRALTLAIVFGAATLFLCSPVQYNYLDSYFFDLTGIDHVASFLGQLSGLAALSTCIYAAVSRLVPHDEVETVMRRAEYPVAFAILIMLIALANTRALRQRAHPDMLQVPPDPWLAVYWVVLIVIAIYLAGFLLRMLLVLRTDPRSRTVATLLAAGSVLTVVSFAAVAWDIASPIPSAIIWAISGAAVITWSLAAYWSVRLRLQRTEGEDPE
jgi:uncharacterized membrane protein